MSGSASFFRAAAFPAMVAVRAVVTGLTGVVLPESLRIAVIGCVHWARLAPTRSRLPSENRQRHQ